MYVLGNTSNNIIFFKSLKKDIHKVLMFSIDADINN